ncbi:TolC family protein [Dokdonella sp.]|uniref:TolC family protein n=1 Tax=Dokdonella sp. TaxID=2291710 RepID=UPI0031C12440|nr:TolC family protein [Dokdonella sp.]
MKRAGFAWPLLLMVPLALAAQAPPATLPLPPDELVLPAIERTPEVQAAAAALARAQAEARLRDVGTHEATLTVIPQRRHLQGGPTFNEWEVDLSRPVRWPHKARLDRDIGAVGVEAARLRFADAHHAGALRLLARWSNWQRATVMAEQQHAEVATWERDHKAIARRVELGDAARRDLLAADAMLAQARAAALQADVDAQVAELALRSDFPDLPLPERIRLGEQPPTLAGTDAYWSGLIVRRSHEIGAADALARQREIAARRARADRLPDPSVGVRVLDDLGGRERAIGLIVSIPIGVRQRDAGAAAAGADALAAQAELTLVRRDIAHGARESLTRVRAAQAIWHSRQLALVAARESAAKLERAYALGESGLAELLVGRRGELEAALAERSAAVDAIEAVARVRIDAHDLWHDHHGSEDAEQSAGPHADLPDL